MATDHLGEVLGQLDGELVVPEAGPLLAEDVGDGGDQQQLLLGVGLGEAVDAEGVQHHKTWAVSKVPGNRTMLGGVLVLVFHVVLVVLLTWQQR